MFSVGQQLVWVHVDDETGERVNDFVKVMALPRDGLKSPSAREQYRVQVLRTGDPAIAFRDELFDYSEE
jgi:hypothetical protein